MKTQIEKKLKKYSAKQLSAKLEKNSISKVEKEVIIEILKSRDQDVSKWEEVVEEKIEVSGKVVNSEDSLSGMKKEVDDFVDSLIEEKRTGVYNQVMKALGGNFYSDLDDLLEEATEQQLKEALSFKGIKKVSEKKVLIDKEELEPVKKTKKKTKNSTSHILENSFEVEFKAASNSKFPNELMRGFVIRQFECPKAKKLFYRIKNDRGVFLKKADSCVKI